MRSLSSRAQSTLVDDTTLRLREPSFGKKFILRFDAFDELRLLLADLFDDEFERRVER